MAQPQTESDYAATHFRRLHAVDTMITDAMKLLVTDANADTTLLALLGRALERSNELLVSALTPASER